MSADSHRPEEGQRPQESAPGGGLPTIDVREYGGRKQGERQSSDRRLFMQLLVLSTPADLSPERLGADLAERLRGAGLGGVIYADLNDPRNVGLLTWAIDPAVFVRSLRPIFAEQTLARAPLLSDFTMIGRTYGTGHEPDLSFALLERPVRNVLNPDYPWHVWYPLRRTGAFARLSHDEQQGILREHAVLGHAYGQQDLAHDVRLACHGLDAKDNEFVIGLVGRELHPLSHLVQSMRKTKQTSEFIQQMGPFFVGHVAHRIAPNG